MSKKVAAKPATKKAATKKTATKKPATKKAAQSKSRDEDSQVDKQFELIEEVFWARCKLGWLTICDARARGTIQEFATGLQLLAAQRELEEAERKLRWYQ